MPINKKIILIIVLGLLIYANSLSNKFIWDDYLLIKDNLYIEQVANFPRLFTTTITAGAGEERGLYRPLQMVTYLFNYALWGLNPGGYHLTNILLQILASVAVYYLIKLLFNDGLIAILTALFFLVHPIHTEAVAYVSGRADILAGIFLLFSLIFYIKTLHSKKIGHYFILSILYLSALLSKEASLIFPLILLLYHYSFKEKIRWVKFSLILGFTVFYIFLRTVIFKNFLPSLILLGDPLQRIPGFFAAIAKYISLLFLPFDLHMEYGKQLFGWHDPRVIAGLIVTVTLIIIAFFKRQTNKIASFSIFWFFLNLLPYSNLYGINAYMAEHWLYLGSIGFFLVLSCYLCFLFRQKNLKLIGITLGLALFIFYAWLTVRQNFYWHDNITFFERNLKYNPESAKLYYNLGLSYDDDGRKLDAIEAYKKALLINQDYFLAHNNLAVVYYEKGRFNLAIEHADKAVSLGYKVHPAFLELLRPYRKASGQN